MVNKHYSRNRLLSLLTIFALPYTIASAQQSVLPALDDPRAFVAHRQVNATGGELRLLGSSHYIGSGSSLVPKDSTALTYTSQTSTLISQQTAYKYGTGTWSPDVQYTYTYNASGFNTQTEYKLWNTSKSVYNNIGRYTYNYSSSNVKTDMLLEFWNTVNSAYVNGFRETYTSDASGNITDIVEQNWVALPGKWENRLHTINTYNSQNEITDNIVQYWDLNNKVWINKWRTTTSYDASGRNILSSTYTIWNPAAGAWINSKRISNALNTAGNVQTASTELYNNSTHAWDKNQKETNSYSASGYISTGIKELWDMMAGSYANTTKVGYSYNSYNQVTMQNVNSWVQGTWGIDGNANRLRNYYEGSGLSVAAESIINLSISPVPASGLLAISFTLNTSQDITVAIVNMTGTIVKQSSYKNVSALNEHLSVSHLPAGSYILSIRSINGERDTKPFIVAH